MAEGEDNLRTKDNRGRSVSMLDPYTLHLLRRHNSIEPGPLADIAADLGSGLTKVTRIALVVGIVCVLPGAIALVIHAVVVLGDGRSIWPLPIWLPLANLWVIPFAIWVGARQARSRRVRSVMLAHRRCPHCGYDLRLLPMDPADGATVCPECGCAWLLGDKT